VNRRMKIVFPLWIILLGGAINGAIAGQDNTKKHRVTVRDTIQMTTLPETTYAANDASSSRFVRYSPNGKQFVVVTQKGDPEKNENEYSLLLFETSEAFDHPKPRLLVSMRSRSNRDAIKNVRWMGNEKLYFIGEVKDSAQVYSLSVASGALQCLTRHPTAVVDFDVDATDEVVVYAAEPGPRSEKEALEKIDHGFVITNETADEIPRSKSAFREPDFSKGEDLFVKRPGREAVNVVLTDRYLPYKPISIAPDGRNAVVAVLVREVPPSWIAYEDEITQAEVKAYRGKATTSWIMRYMLLDLKTNKVRPLHPGPAIWASSGTAWLNGGKSIAASGVFLPLDVSDPSELEARKKHPFAVEVNCETGKFEKITGNDLIVSRWDSRTSRLFFRAASRTAPPVPLTYGKGPSGWIEESTSLADNPKNDLPEITLEQDLNTPAKLYANDLAHSRKALLLDLNPQFSQIEFGKVEAVRWKATDGHEVEGGLYLPPDYQKGVRYPLVIQTHGFSKDQFWVNGPWNSAFAAQPLAARDIVVLQIGHGTEPGGYMKHHRSLEEAPREMAAYEGAIDYLDGLGLIDRECVGIIAFSRTQYHVEYTLTHSSYHFRAATLADGFDGGYLQYLVNPFSEKDHVFVNGGPPFGSTFANWLEHSPTFGVEKVHLPVRIECFGYGVIGCWEWFSLLTHLGRPVEMINLPDAIHILVKPWERLTSQQGNVDWFCFWLKGEEDHDPSKSEQYARWRELQKLQAEQAGKLVCQ